MGFFGFVKTKYINYVSWNEELINWLIYLFIWFLLFWVCAVDFVCVWGGEIVPLYSYLMHA